MNILVPITLTDAMLSSSTIAEPDTGETVWVSGATYAIGNQRIRTTTHRIYSRLTAGAGTTPPETDLTNWQDIGPTNRWAAFDGVVNTPSTAPTSFTYVLRPGFFNALSFYGLDGATLDVSLKDAPGGAVVFTGSYALQEPPIDYYDYYFGQIRSLSKLPITGLLPYADPELTITITATLGATVGIGMIVIGDMRQIVSDQTLGGTQYGASAEPISYSYIKTDAFGRTTIVRRHSATNLRLSVFLPQADADAALATVQDVLDVPAAWIGSDASGYAGLNAFGLGSGSLSYDGPTHAILSITVKGFI